MNTHSFGFSDESPRSVGSVAQQSWLASAALAISMLCAGCANPMDGSSRYLNSYMNESPPELSDGVWLNSEQPLSLAALRGQVVWLEFSFLH